MIIIGIIVLTHTALCYVTIMIIIFVHNIKIITTPSELFVKLGGRNTFLSHECYSLLLENALPPNVTLPLKVNKYWRITLHIVMVKLKCYLRNRFKILFFTLPILHQCVAKLSRAMLFIWINFIFHTCSHTRTHAHTPIYEDAVHTSSHSVSIDQHRHSGCKPGLDCWGNRSPGAFHWTHCSQWRRRPFGQWRWHGFEKMLHALWGRRNGENALRDRLECGPAHRSFILLFSCCR